MIGSRVCLIGSRVCLIGSSVCLIGSPVALDQSNVWSYLSMFIISWCWAICSTVLGAGLALPVAARDHRESLPSVSSHRGHQIPGLRLEDIRGFEQPTAPRMHAYTNSALSLSLSLFSHTHTHTSSPPRPILCVAIEKHAKIDGGGYASIQSVLKVRWAWAWFRFLHATIETSFDLH